MQRRYCPATIFTRQRTASRVMAMLCALAVLFGAAPLSAQSFELGPDIQTEQNRADNSEAQNSDETRDQDSAETEPVNWFDYKVANLRALNKITGRTRTFTMTVGNSRKFGDIYIRLRACREPPPIEKRESAAFLQVWETGRSGESQWIFSGWMFASSPALSSMDHPVYDVWLLDCTQKVEDQDEGNDSGAKQNRDEAGQDGTEQGTAQDDSGATQSPAVGEDDEPVIRRERLPAE